LEQRRTGNEAQVVGLWRAAVAALFEGVTVPDGYRPKRKRILDSMVIWITTSSPEPSVDQLTLFFNLADLLVELRILLTAAAIGPATAALWARLDVARTKLELDYQDVLKPDHFRRQS
jgi:hypothetical protein